MGMTFVDLRQVARVGIAVLHDDRRCVDANLQPRIGEIPNPHMKVVAEALELDHVLGERRLKRDWRAAFDLEDGRT